MQAIQLIGPPAQKHFSRTFQIRLEHLLDDKISLIQVQFQCLHANHVHGAINSSGVPPADGPHSYISKKWTTIILMDWNREKLS